MQRTGRGALTRRRRSRARRATRVPARLAMRFVSARPFQTLSCRRLPLSCQSIMLHGRGVAWVSRAQRAPVTGERAVCAPPAGEHCRVRPLTPDTVPPSRLLPQTVHTAARALASTPSDTRFARPAVTAPSALRASPGDTALRSPPLSPWHHVGGAHTMERSHWQSLSGAH